MARLPLLALALTQWPAWFSTVKGQLSNTVCVDEYEWVSIQSLTDLPSIDAFTDSLPGTDDQFQGTEPMSRRRLPLHTMHRCQCRSVCGTVPSLSYPH